LGKAYTYLRMRLFLILGLLWQCHGWWCTGHMLVAMTALRSGLMTEEEIQKANATLNGVGLNTMYPASPEFVSSACWADDLKAQREYVESNMHYINLPIIAPGYTGKIPTVDATNAPWAISQANITVSSPLSTVLDKARMTRFIIHFVGDIHQPLHAVNYFSSQFASGDQGGNLWKIADPQYHMPNLHQLWDSGIGLWANDPARPLDATSWEWLSKTADALMAENPASDPVIAALLKDTNTMSWANASWELAETFVYTIPEAPTVVPAAYYPKGQKMCQRQVAVAGYRLALLLKSVFRSSIISESLSKI